MNGKTRKIGKYDKDYFVVNPPYDGDSLPSLSGDEDTIFKLLTKEEFRVGTKPLIFHNGFADLQKERNCLWRGPLPLVLFAGANILVEDAIAEKLLKYDIQNLVIRPAVYIDPDNRWHENYCYLQFLKDFDCWDRDNSDYKKIIHEDEDGNLDEDEPNYVVYTYSLNEKLLDELPLKGRLLFQMDVPGDWLVVAHKSIAGLFRVKGVELVPIYEYE